MFPNVIPTYYSHDLSDDNFDILSVIFISYAKDRWQFDELPERMLFLRNLMFDPRIQWITSWTPHARRVEISAWDEILRNLRYQLVISPGASFLSAAFQHQPYYSLDSGIERKTPDAWHRLRRWYIRIHFQPTFPNALSMRLQRQTLHTQQIIGMAFKNSVSAPSNSLSCSCFHGLYGNRDNVVNIGWRWNPAASGFIDYRQQSIGWVGVASKVIFPPMYPSSLKWDYQHGDSCALRSGFFEFKQFIVYTNPMCSVAEFTCHTPCFSPMTECRVRHTVRPSLLLTRLILR